MVVGGGGGGGGCKVIFSVKPNRCVKVRLRLGWGFDNIHFPAKKLKNI